MAQLNRLSLFFAVLVAGFKKVDLIESTGNHAFFGLDKWRLKPMYDAIDNDILGNENQNCEQSMDKVVRAYEALNRMIVITGKSNGEEKKLLKLKPALESLIQLKKLAQMDKFCDNESNRKVSTCIKNSRLRGTNWRHIDFMVRHYVIKHANRCIFVYNTRLLIRQNEKTDRIVLQLIEKIEKNHSNLLGTKPSANGLMPENIRWPKQSDNLTWGETIAKFLKEQSDTLDTESKSCFNLRSDLKLEFQNKVIGPCKNYVNRYKRVFSQAKADLEISMNWQSMFIIKPNVFRSFIRSYTLFLQCEHLIKSKRELYNSLKAYQKDQLRSRNWG